MSIRDQSTIDWTSLRAQAYSESKQTLEKMLLQSKEHAQRMQGRGIDLQIQTVTYKKLKPMSKVYEYVAFYVPTAADLEKYPDLKESIILDDKLIAESEQAAKTRVIRLIPNNYEPVIDKVTIEVRAFR